MRFENGFIWVVFGVLKYYQDFWMVCWCCVCWVNVVVVKVVYEFDQIVW